MCERWIWGCVHESKSTNELMPESEWICEWMNECGSKFVNEWMNECGSKSVNEWMTESVSVNYAWVGKSANEWMLNSEWIGEGVNLNELTCAGGNKSVSECETGGSKPMNSYARVNLNEWMWVCKGINLWMNMCVKHWVN